MPPSPVRAIEISTTLEMGDLDLRNIRTRLIGTAAKQPESLRIMIEDGMATGGVLDEREVGESDREVHEQKVRRAC